MRIMEDDLVAHRIHEAKSEVRCTNHSANSMCYEAACWPSFALEIFCASNDGVTCYTCHCIMCIDICYAFWHQSVGRTKNIMYPHTSKLGGTCTPINSVHEYNYKKNGNSRLGQLVSPKLQYIIQVEPPYYKTYHPGVEH